MTEAEKQKNKIIEMCRDGQWYFDAYAFQQRKVTGEEFAHGVRRENAEGFLTEVALQLRKGHN